MKGLLCVLSILPEKALYHSITVKSVLGKSNVTEVKEELRFVTILSVVMRNFTFDMKKLLRYCIHALHTTLSTGHTGLTVMSVKSIP